MTPYELILSESIFPYIRYIRKYGVYPVYGAFSISSIWKSQYGLGQTYIHYLGVTAVHIALWLSTPDTLISICIVHCG
jgi:hypothetical protein